MARLEFDSYIFKMRQALYISEITRCNENGVKECIDVTEIPVFVYPMPTINGQFVVEFKDGTAQRVEPESLIFIDGSEKFEQYSW